MARRLVAELLHRRLKKIPARRTAEVHDIGLLICYLSSSSSDFVSGGVCVIDGDESSAL
jgi:2-deoxy-D-gluconate 3-dehydrogenase